MGWHFGIKWGHTGQVTVSPLELKAPHSLWGRAHALMLAEQHCTTMFLDTIKTLHSNLCWFGSDVNKHTYILQLWDIRLHGFLFGHLTQFIPCFPTRGQILV